jgi:hypothetical protein
VIGPRQTGQTAEQKRSRGWAGSGVTRPGRRPQRRRPSERVEQVDRQEAFGVQAFRGLGGLPCIAKFDDSFHQQLALGEVLIRADRPRELQPALAATNLVDRRRHHLAAALPANDHALHQAREDCLAAKTCSPRASRFSRVRSEVRRGESRRRAVSDVHGAPPVSLSVAGALRQKWSRSLLGTPATMSGDRARSARVAGCWARPGGRRGRPCRLHSVPGRR